MKIDEVFPRDPVQTFFGSFHRSTIRMVAKKGRRKGLTGHRAGILFLLADVALEFPDLARNLILPKGWMQKHIREKFQADIEVLSEHSQGERSGIPGGSGTETAPHELDRLTDLKGRPADCSLWKEHRGEVGKPRLFLRLLRRSGPDQDLDRHHGERGPLGHEENQTVVPFHAMPERHRLHQPRKHDAEQKEDQASPHPRSYQSPLFILHFSLGSRPGTRIPTVRFSATRYFLATRRRSSRVTARIPGR